jgi:hypothetical protein
MKMKLVLFSGVLVAAVMTIAATLPRGTVMYYPDTFGFSPTNLLSSNSVAIAAAAGAGGLTNNLATTNYVNTATNDAAIAASNSFVARVNGSSTNQISTNPTNYGTAHFRGGTTYFDDGIEVGDGSVVNGTLTVQRLNATNAMLTNPTNIGGISYGNSSLTNALFLDGSGEVLSNALGIVTISGGNITLSNRGNAALGIIPTATNIAFSVGSPAAVFNSVMTLKTNGNVGIGTNNPQSKLHVTDLTPNSDPAIDLSNDAQTWRIQTYGTDVDQLRFYDVNDARVGLGISGVDGVVYVPNGLHSTNTIGTAVLGNGAGISGGISNGVAIGENAGYLSSGMNGSSAIGRDTGRSANNAYYSVFEGPSAGRASTNSYQAVFLGFGSGRSSYNSYSSIYMGYNAGYGTESCYDSIYEGLQAGMGATNCYESVFIGRNSGKDANGPHRSVFLGAYSGTNTVRPHTLIIDTEGQGTNGLVYGEFDTSMLRVNGDLAVMNVLYSKSSSNGVVGNLVLQPIGLFGSLMMGTTNYTYGAQNAYLTLTNYGTVRTNGVLANAVTGFLTNTIAGFYRIHGAVSLLPATADMIELEVFINETGREEISSFGAYDNPPRVRTLPLTGGIIYLPANSGVSLRVNNRSATNTAAIWRASLNIGTP